MSARSDVKQETKTNASISDASHRKSELTPGIFRPFAAPRRKAGLRDDQIAVSTHSISLSITTATLLGEKVSVLWSDSPRAIAIQKSAEGDYKLKQLGKNKSSRVVYCKSLLEAKKVKPGRYTSIVDSKTFMVMASVN